MIPLRIVLISIAAVCLLAVGRAYAQDVAGGQKILVIPVSVTSNGDPSGYVKGLAVSDFEVFYKKQALEVVGLQSPSGPRAIGMILDNSGSMTDSKERVERSLAGLGLLRSRLDKSRSFASRFKEYATETFEITEVPDTADLIDLSYDGSTNYTLVYDAVVQMISKLEGSGSENKVIFIISDGVDNLSKHNFKGVLESVRQSNVVIYPLLVASRERTFFTGETFLARIAFESGGKMLEMSKNFTPDEVAVALEAELNNLYFLKVRVGAQGKTPKRRSISVRLTSDTKERVGKVKVHGKEHFVF